MPHRLLLNKLKRLIIYRVLSLNDTPHRIALGVGVAMFVTFTPTMGFQMILTVALCALLRANKFVGVPFVWISNPLTVLLVYGPSFLLGAWSIPGDSYSWSSFQAAALEVMDFSGPWWRQMQSFWTAMVSLLLPLWLGSILVATGVGAVSYAVTYWGVVKFRRVYHHLFDHQGRRIADLDEIPRDMPRDEKAAEAAPPGEGVGRPAEGAGEAGGKGDNAGGKTDEDAPKDPPLPQAQAPEGLAAANSSQKSA